MSNRETFEAFMLAYQNMVFTTAVRLLANPSEAEDIAQEVFLKAYQRFDEIGQSPTAGGWLKTVTTNLCLNHLSRYRARWRFFSEMASEDDDEGIAGRIPAADSVDGSAHDADRRRLIEAALQKLPSPHRVPLVLYHFEGKSYEEISEQLRISISKVKTDIHRGREALRRKLGLSVAGELSEGMVPSPRGPGVSTGRTTSHSAES